MRKQKNTYYNTIVKEALAGDPNAFAVLYASSYQDIYRRCIRSIDNEYDIQDTMHNTYVVAYKRLPQLTNPDSFPKWILLICESQISSTLRGNGMLTQEINRRLKRRPPRGTSDRYLSRDNASQLLESVFLAVDSEPNTVDLDSLDAYHQYRSSKLVIQRLVPIIIIAALIIIPLLLIAPDMTVTMDTVASTPSSARYLIKVSSLLPVNTVIAELDGANQLVTQEEAELYSVDVTSNGTLKIETTIWNSRKAEEEIEVTTIDRDIPQVLEYHLSNGNLVLTVTDGDGYGVDYDSITLTRTSDLVVNRPSSVNTETGQVVIPYGGGEGVLYLADLAGNSTSFALTPS